MNTDGKMKKIIGKSIFTGIFAATSRMFSERRRRKASLWARRTWAMLVPICSAWMMAATKEDSSGRGIRSARRRQACPRGTPRLI